jgi:hypothetical protein
MNVFAGGYDLTGYDRSAGPLTWSFEEADATTIADGVKCCIPNQATINVGTLNAVLDNTTKASLDQMKTQANKAVSIALGMRAAPAQGDPAFCMVKRQEEDHGRRWRDHCSSGCLQLELDGGVLCVGRYSGYDHSG